MVNAYNLVGLIAKFARRRILLAGDLMLDRYTKGQIRRISPEAPVSVLQVQEEESRAGGAGNAALNISALGQQVVLLGRVGPDSAGEEILSSLKSEGIETSGVVIEPSYATPIKNRFIAGNQQILRVDYEQVVPLQSATEKSLLAQLPTLLEGVDLVAISDYGKGLFTPTLLSGLIALSRERGIPVIADPKGRDFARYSGSTLLKPNLNEAIEASGLESTAPLDVVAAALFAKLKVDHLMVTRGEKGISLFSKSGERTDFATLAREVRDVTGAGDTVLAALAAALANSLPLHAAIHLANEAAGLAVQRFGCAKITLRELARHLLVSDATQKVFREDHLFALTEALKGESYTLLAIDSRQGLTSAIFRGLLELAAKGETLIVYIEDESPDPEFVSLIASLVEVDFIVLSKENIVNLSQAISPQATFRIQGDRLMALGEVERLLNERLKPLEATEYS